MHTYAPTFTVRLVGLPKLVMLTTPAHLKALFTSPVEVMHAGEANASAFGPVVGTRTHFVLEEASHLERRRLLLPSFHGDRMHEYGEAMDEVASQAVAVWPERRPFSIHPELQQITLQVIIRTIFGLDDATSRDDQLRRQLIRLANVALASPLLLVPPRQWDLGLVAGEDHGDQLVAQLGVGETLALLVLGEEQKRQDVLPAGAVTRFPPPLDLGQEEPVALLDHAGDPAPRAEPGPVHDRGLRTAGGSGRRECSVDGASASGPLSGA